jgi:predicted DNA-binding transcriptional regulator AlpA
MIVEITTSADGNQHTLKARVSPKTRLSRKEVAALLGISYRTFQRRLAAGLIPAPVEVRPDRWMRSQFPVRGSRMMTG